MSNLIFKAMKAKKLYTKWNRAKSRGTGYKCSVKASYKKLVRLFGQPLPLVDYGDGKVSTEWVMTDKYDNVVTLYDYCQTNLYAKGYPSVEEFRNQRSYEWHIGGNNAASAEDLKNYILASR